MKVQSFPGIKCCDFRRFSPKNWRLFHENQCYGNFLSQKSVFEVEGQSPDFYDCPQEELEDMKAKMERYKKLFRLERRKRTRTLEKTKRLTTSLNGIKVKKWIRMKQEYLGWLDHNWSYFVNLANSQTRIEIKAASRKYVLIPPPKN
jgi:hypothetical protein